MNIPNDRKYADTHEWIRMEEGIGLVGISDHAQAELGDMVFVELPKTGLNVTIGQACVVVESVKAASDVYAPVTGEIIEVNAAVAENPALLNTDCYGEGWMFRIRPADLSDLEKLNDAAEYRAHIGG